MSLVRPKPRHADDVSDAFERLYSASPMSKLLSSESGWGANHSNFSLVSPSPFKHPASVTPVAKIFLQLKKSEGNLSVDSDDRGVDCSRRDSDGFRAFNTDSDSSRHSLELQQGVEEHDEAVHFSTHSYLLRNSSDAPGQPGYANCEERRGTETGKECLLSVSPRRIHFQRLNGSVEGNEKLVTRGRGMKCSLRDIEEESDYVGVIGEEERARLDFEENGEPLGKMAELGPEENMSCCESEESKESGDETEMRQGRFNEQIRELVSKHNEQNDVRRRSKKLRARKRRIVSEESDSSEEENERRTEAHGRKPQTEERGQSEDDSEERRKRGSDGNKESEAATRGQSQENEEYIECTAGRRTTQASRSRRKHDTGESDEPESESEARDMCKSEGRRKNGSDGRTESKEEEGRRQQSEEEDWDYDDSIVGRRVIRTSKREHNATDDKRLHLATGGEFENKRKTKSSTEFKLKRSMKQVVSQSSKSGNHRKPRSIDRLCNNQVDNVQSSTRKTRSLSLEKEGTRLQSLIVVSSSDEESGKVDKRNTAKNTAMVTFETPTFRRVTRNMAANRRIGGRDKLRESEDHIHKKKACVDEARVTDKQETMVKITTGADLGETPVISRKLLKVTAVQQHTLDNWTIIQLGHNIGVDGHRPGDPASQFWHSNSIVKRISSHAVCTVSGTVYTLRGKLAEEEALAEGFSKKVVAAFQKGFPPSWKEIIQEHHEARRRKRSSKPRPSELKVPIAQQKMKPTRKSNNQSVKHTTGVTATPEAPVISSLPKTRSGRHVIPQLAWWTGQRVTINPDCHTVDIAPGTPDTQCASVSSDSLRRRTTLGQKPDTSSHGSLQPKNKRHLTEQVEKQQAMGARGCRREGSERGQGKHGKDSGKRRQNSMTGSKKEGSIQGPTRRLRQHRKDMVKTKALTPGEESYVSNTPVHRLFSERSMKDVGDGNAGSTHKTAAPCQRLTTKALSFLEQHERTGINGPVSVTHSVQSMGDDARSYVSDSTGNSLGQEDDNNNPVSKLDYLSGVKTTSEASSSETNAHANLGKNGRAKTVRASFAPGNLTKDILGILKTNKRTNAKRRMEKVQTCYSLRRGGSVGDSSSSESDKDITEGDGNKALNRVYCESETRNNLTSLAKTPRHRDDAVLLCGRWNGGRSRHTSDTKQLDILQTEERVNQRLSLSGASSKTPVSRFKEHMTDDILCRSVEHKCLFSGDDADVVDVRQRSNRGLRLGLQRNIRSDRSKIIRSGKSQAQGPPSVDLCGKERTTKHGSSALSDSMSHEKQKQPSVRQQRPTHVLKSLSQAGDKQSKKQLVQKRSNGRNSSNNRKGASLSRRSKEPVSSVQRVCTDDSEDEIATAQHEMLKCRQKASKAPEKGKTAAALSDKTEKQLGKFVGGVGTLKRKRQLREFVEQHECGYENDLFDSTPFRQCKVRKVDTVATLKGNDAVDDFFDATAGRLSFATPGSTPSSSLRSAWLPTSDKKTPSSHSAASPLLPQSVNRNAIDRYVHRVKRVAKRNTKVVQGAMVAASSVVARHQGLTSHTLTSVSPSVFLMANRTDDVDSSNADDYYFSDGSDGM